MKEGGERRGGGKEFFKLEAPWIRFPQFVKLEGSSEVACGMLRFIYVWLDINEMFVDVLSTLVSLKTRADPYLHLAELTFHTCRVILEVSQCYLSDI